jgi:transposase
MGWFAGRGRRGSRWRSARRATSSAAPAIGSRPTSATRSGSRRLFAAGDLKLVWIPSPEQEQLRDLVRCREDLRSDLMRARHRLATFLLRRERYFPGPGGRWTLKHRHWLSQQHFDDQASRITYADYLHAHDVVLARRDRVGRELAQLAQSCVWGETIARLCCLRGINTLTALGLCAEIGDW